MLMLAFVFLASVACVSLVGLLQATRARARRRRLATLELKPNCLLTRYPILFLSRPRALFTAFDHWNEVPQFLSEHGYDVRVAEWDGTKDSVTHILSGLNSRAHIIGDSVCASALGELAQSGADFIESLTRVENTGSPRKVSEPRASLRPEKRPVEIFPIELDRAELVFDWRASLASAFAAFTARGKRVDPIETAAVATRTPWALETKFLDLAVSLAERDARGGFHP